MHDLNVSFFAVYHLPNQSQMRTIYYLPLLVLALLIHGDIYSQAVNFNGNIRDMESGENLAYARITLKSMADSTEYSGIADHMGNINFSVPKGKYRVTVDNFAYERRVYNNVELSAPTNALNFEMEEDGKSLRMAEVATMNNTMRRDKRSKSMAPSFSGTSASYSWSTEGYYKEAPVSVDMIVMDDGTDDRRRSPDRSGNNTGKGLTGAEVNDFSKWEMWTDLLEDDLKMHAGNWKFNPARRFCVQLEYAAGFPVVDAQVVLTDGKNRVWSTRTDNTGKAELWGQMFQGVSGNTHYTIVATYKGVEYEISKPKEFASGINFMTLPENCEPPASVVDLVWVVDATGSMGDEIKALKEDMVNVMQMVARGSKFQYRFGSVFYRDAGDDYVFKKQDFITDLEAFTGFLSAQYANGGGDYPEAVDVAMEQAIGNLEWSKDAVARIMFLVLDAPPHHNAESLEKMQKYTRMAAEKGIRIVPVGCTGVDRSTEYLMRSIALGTNGTYLFTTEHSGIGSGHIRPLTDTFDVDRLNIVLARTIYNFTDVRSCDNTDLVSDTSLQDTNWVELPIDSLVRDTLTYILDSNGVDTLVSDTVIIRDTIVQNLIRWKYYPNPTSGIMTVELDPVVRELYLSDMSGKLIQRWNTEGTERLMIDISQFPSGMYFLGFFHEDQWMSGKVVLVRT